MNRAELVEKVRSEVGLAKGQAEEVVEATVRSVIAAVKAGERVNIFGFGTFNPSSRAARTGRNPQTGAPVKIAASKGVRFAPASAFKFALNPKSAKKTVPVKAAGRAAAKATKSAKAAPAKAAKAAKSTKAAPAKATKATKSTKKR
ncbi:MAG TPA: HU family DNA-binding protein [Acidimicrobiales bacterium]|nr:HU family DNA-binding protein [Acidimicrobiales bacterium]